MKVQSAAELPPRPSLSEYYASKEHRAQAAVEVWKRHAARIRANLIEMRRCLKKSEAARDTYYALQDAYKSRGLEGFELDEALKTNREAQAAVSDNQMYDRWATKYAAIVQAETAAYNLDIHADGEPK